MSLILAVVLSASITGAPSIHHKPVVTSRGLTAKTTAEKLAAYIIGVNPAKDPADALLLAQRIVIESKRHKIDVALLAAVAHNESWYRPTVKGTSYERGCWQLWPWAPLPSWELG